MYSFDLAQTEEVFYIAEQVEQIVLLRIDIGAFQESEIPQERLNYLFDILEFFKKNRKGMILRFAYDTNGNGMQKEPKTIELVQTHMKQIAEVLLAFRQDILCVQGVFVGDWGEMHGSKFLTAKGMSALVKTMLVALQGTCLLAVRTPQQYRMLKEMLSLELTANLTLFNDGIFGSDTDLGTYAATEEWDGQTGKSWSREFELSWQEEKMEHCCFGGEAVLGVTSTGTQWEAEKVLSELEKMHIDYLNSTYDTRLLEQWKKIKMTGKQESLYDYVSLHLGYRFVVREVSLKKEVIKIQIENTGFSSLQKDAECSLLLRKDGKLEQKIVLDTDVTLWESKKICLIEGKLPQSKLLKGTKLYLHLQLSEGGQTIYFANLDAKNKESKQLEEELLLGSF